ncbi:MAG: glycosyl transferase [Oscillospiraceae bacterium]|nr:glycosyl transferase [Oscillospiraceae bacterium]
MSGTEQNGPLRIFWFCIPAYGHTNPTIEVVRELCRRGHEVRYYSFADFREKIEDAGAVFVPCDGYLPPIDARSERRLRRVSTTEMSVQSFRTTALMDAALAQDVAALRPDLIVSDSACFWGKLTAQKYGLPLVCSTTTFAFNEHSSRYMHYSAAEMADMILGLPRLNRELARLRPLGYHAKSALDIVRDKNDVDTIVYTSALFQPFVETFDPMHFRFVGPSVKAVEPDRAPRPRPRVYVSLGTVINSHPEFYRNCIAALRDEPVDLLISCGLAFDPACLDPLPANVRVEPYVDQMEVLAQTDLFITHCGMNSASEALYMGVPELLYPLTGEQQAVARRVTEMGAGRLLTRAEAESPERIRAVVHDLLLDGGLKRAAEAMRQDFLSCAGPAGAADFIEQRGREARAQS